MPFKCGVDICFNRSHVTANLHDETVNYYAYTEVFKDYAMYQVKHFFKEDIKTFEIKEIYRNDDVYKI